MFRVPARWPKSKQRIRSKLLQKNKGIMYAIREFSTRYAAVNMAHETVMGRIDEEQIYA